MAVTNTLGSVDDDQEVQKNISEFEYVLKVEPQGLLTHQMLDMRKRKESRTTVSVSTWESGKLCCYILR